MSPLESMDKMKQASTTKSNINDELLKEVFPVGNFIDEKNYYIGPNDVLSIQAIPFDVLPMLVIVTSECSIVHQNFGEIKLRGLTLSEVRDSINKIANSRKSNAKVIISLMQARKVLVTIKGNVITPSTYIFPASYSVSTAIKYANQAQSTQTMNNTDEQSAVIRLQESQKERERLFSESGVSETSLYGNRNIRLIRGSGTAMIVDLDRAVAMEDATYDPFVKEGDEIFVPFEPSEYPVISIAGEILRPISVAYKEGDMASHLLKMGYGFTENADMDNIILHDATGATRKLNADSTCKLLDSDFELSMGSIIIVGSKPKVVQNKFGIVSVKGEVNNPNVYTIELGNTSLTDVIAMAGKFTDKAYLPLASISRRDNSQNERISLRRKYSEYFQHSNMTQQDTLRFSMEMDMKKPMVSCDFTACFVDGNPDYDLLLQDGDVIYIPKRPNKVNVFGQVKNPGFIDFIENQNMEWYVNKAGGYATNADIKRTRIIRGSNRVWVDGFEDFVYVNDGDEIFVPSPRDVPPEMELQKWAAFAGIAGVVISLIGLLFNIYLNTTK
jgi:protein involved in polysaccharide export with SLBB domain